MGIKHGYCDNYQPVFPSRRGGDSKIQPGFAEEVEEVERGEK